VESGLRVIAIAYKPIHNTAISKEDEKEMVLADLLCWKIHQADIIDTIASFKNSASI
jgi:magnesium-transporting ATPase (P-type)